VDITPLLSFIHKQGASDLHISTGAPPIIRLHGELKKTNAPPLTAEQVLSMLHGIMNDPQRRFYKDNLEIDFSIACDFARFRVNAFHQRRGPAGVFRIIPNDVLSFEQLGLPAVIADLALKDRGLVLVTGPTGSGKSTTLASIIDFINTRRSAHIITIEDPIEFIHDSKNCLVNQREVGGDTHSFANALRSALREDPDVILVGEMRDPETVRAAMTAAQTGHLVMSTLHTIDATETINRVIDFFPLHEQKQVRIMLAGTLKGIISQRLLQAASGSGRVPAVEIMIMTNRIRDFILDPDQAHMVNDAITEGEYYGMQTFDQSLLRLYEAGEISLADASQVARNPHDFKLLVQQQGHDVSLMPY